MKMMYAMLVALAPATFYALYAYRLRALLMVVTGVLSAMAAEALFQKLTGRKLTVADGSAAVTGLLLALAVSVSTPLYAIAVSAAFGIVAGKQLLGGLGKNLFNPALFGRLFYLFVFPDSILPWRQPADLSTPVLVAPVDMITQATPLEMLRATGETATPVLDLFLGRIPGTIGEISSLALLMGAGFLVYKGYLRWRITASVFATVLVLSLMAGQNPFFHFFAGSLMLGACFMATDPMTSPRHAKGQVVFGIGIGLVIMGMRWWGWQSPGVYEFTEGTTFAILTMNLFVPLLNRRLRPVDKQ